MEGKVPIVRDVSRFAKCTPVFYGDDEVVSQQRFHGRNIPTLIRRIPFVLECDNFGRYTVWLALSGRRIQSPNCSAARTRRKILIFIRMRIFSRFIGVGNVVNRLVQIRTRTDAVRPFPSNAGPVPGKRRTRSKAGAIQRVGRR